MYKFMPVPSEIAKQECAEGKARERAEARERFKSKIYKPLVFTAKVYSEEALKGAARGAVKGAALGYIGTVAFKYMKNELVPYVTKKVDQKLENCLKEHPGTKFILDIDKKQAVFWRKLFGLGKDNQITEIEKKEYNLIPSRELIMPFRDGRCML